MCTAISYRPDSHYFGRNLDLEYSFKEQVVITPRNYLFKLRNGNNFYNRFAMIGMASVLNEYPLYYEAANEKGLAMAGLNFPENAVYWESKRGMKNITSFELIPWILGQAENLNDVRNLLDTLNITNEQFSEQIPTQPLHFMISDKSASIVVEPTESGLKVYDNPYNVMTNNPPFEYHLWNIRNYRNLSNSNGENTFTSSYDLDSYAVGMGAIGLPGDASSASRFVRCAFNLANLPKEGDEYEHITEFFHVLDSVSMIKGSTLTDTGKYDITLYSCCINANSGTYYYKMYGNNRINAIRLSQVNLDSEKLFCYDLKREQDIRFDN